ncbi:ADP-ribosylglycohydrolase [bacterium 1xD42-67]|jgi:ADP-ribosyl-[dinitrogen reductase] hydrolase|nr:ADP-ribosylglycohydrolase family protein [uncultured Acetatifactor sp.]RKI68189.1 ADP-ribosylglycohydrolase [bacterium 1xD42-67]
MTFEHTVKSAILGLVVGDALGVPVEFQSREELEQDPVTGMRAYGTHHQPAGTWSDDSSMALCLLESLTHSVSYDDMMARFLRWAEEGYMTAHGDVFDMGIATRQALTKYAKGTPPLKCGGTGTYDNGNGSLMRILPLALYLHRTMGPEFPRKPEAFQIIHNASALTHAHPISLIACDIYCSIANELLCGRSSPADIQHGITAAKEMCASLTDTAPYLDTFKRVDVDVLRSLPKSEIRGSGYVVHTLEATLWCLLHTDSYRACVLEAVNLGEDTDTVGAVAGGLAGIQYGMADIPEEWLAVLAKRSEIEALCQAFAQSQ